MGLALMKFLSELVDRKTFVLTCTMHLSPHLEYGDIFFHGSAKSLMDCLQRIQYQAGLIAAGFWKNTNKEKLYSELGWESLTERRNLRFLLTYHTIISGKTTPYLNEFGQFEPPNASSTLRYQNTFFPYCYSKYDELDPSLKALDFNPFKSNLHSSIRPSKSGTFNVNDMYGLK